MLVEYSVRKTDLITLLKSLHLLEEDDELLYVNNVELRTPKEQFVSVLVDKIKNKATLNRTPSDMTEKELENELMHLLALEKFLNREFNSLREQLTTLMSELQSRAVNTSVTQDGIPLDVEEKLNKTLEGLLGDEPNT